MMPMIHGCWASSPSRKNPNTKLPPTIFEFVQAPAVPPPAVTGYITVANGSSLSGSSSLTAVWYPIMRTLYLSPNPFISALSATFEPSPKLFFQVSSGATCPIHQTNPSLPTKCDLRNPCSNIITA